MGSWKVLEKSGIFFVSKRVGTLSIRYDMMHDLHWKTARQAARVVLLFHWVATLGKLFTHIASPVSQLQETGVQKGVFGA